MKNDGVDHHRSYDEFSCTFKRQPEIPGSLERADQDAVFELFSRDRDATFDFVGAPYSQEALKSAFFAGEEFRLEQIRHILGTGGTQVQHFVIEAAGDKNHLVISKGVERRRSILRAERHRSIFVAAMQFWRHVQFHAIFELACRLRGRVHHGVEFSQVGISAGSIFQNHFCRQLQ